MEKVKVTPRLFLENIQEEIVKNFGNHLQCKIFDFTGDYILKVESNNEMFYAFETKLITALAELYQLLSWIGIVDNKLVFAIAAVEKEESSNEK